MEFILLFVLIAIAIIVFANIDAAKPQDSREPYLRDEGGSVWALYVAGPEGDLPSHESYIHDGTPHQNPATNTYIGLGWFLIIPIWTTIEERYYPITVNAYGTIDFDGIRGRIDGARLRRNQAVDLVVMPGWAERQAIRRENGEQLARGVESGRLANRGR